MKTATLSLLQRAKLAIVLARIHASDSSSCLRLDDAKYLLEMDRYNDAVKAAADSLRHSVGVFHPDYQVVVDMVEA